MIKGYITQTASDPKRMINIVCKMPEKAQKARERIVFFFVSVIPVQAADKKTPNSNTTIAYMIVKALKTVISHRLSQTSY